MSNIRSSKAWLVKMMRWVARLLSVPWAFVALFFTWFLAVNYRNEGFFGAAVSVIIVVVGLLMFMGAPIIASVWGKEALGGAVLLVDGVLVTAAGTLAPHQPMLTHEWRSTAIAFAMNGL